MIFELNRRDLLVGMSVLGLAACTTPPPSPKFAKLTFGHLRRGRAAMGE